MDGQPGKQRLIAFKQLLERVQKQALAKAPRTRQKIMSTLVEQPPDVGGLIDVVAVLLPNFAEGLNANGQSAFAHGRTLL